MVFLNSYIILYHIAVSYFAFGFPYYRTASNRLSYKYGYDEYYTQ